MSLPRCGSVDFRTAAVGPVAGEWIRIAGIAVNAEVPVSVLREVIVQFPSLSEIVRPGRGARAPGAGPAAAHGFATA